MGEQMNDDIKQVQEGVYSTEPSTAGSNPALSHKFNKVTKMNNFKVFDNNTKKWLDPKDFFVNSNGKLCMLNGRVMCEVLEHVICVESTGQVDDKGLELFEGDEVEQGLICFVKPCWYIKIPGHNYSNFMLYSSNDLLKTGSKYKEN